ncbi:hypothetical protein M5K25_025903 [Dendrobium thyrsiflorum]|uniref:Uncharacterized protein n=1 Tax=Dendrobium thyrsiflorum TaxID=117978 RepID=A0ABD0TVW9_DENTH
MVCLNKNHRHNMAFRAYFIILLLLLLVPYFMDCRAIIDGEIPQISKVAGDFPSRIYTNLMDLTKRRKLIGERIDPVIPGPYDPSTCGPQTVPNLTAPPPGPSPDELPPDPNLTKPHRCLKCYYVPQKVPCHCHK